MVITRGAAVLLAFVLAACRAPSLTMVKPGATTAEFERDKQICTDQADRAYRTQVSSRDAKMAHNRVLLSCMRDRGWEQSADVSGERG
jgi:hypothetical protein